MGGVRLFVLREISLKKQNRVFKRRSMLEDYSWFDKTVFYIVSVDICRQNYRPGIDGNERTQTRSYFQTPGHKPFDGLKNNGQPGFRVSFRPNRFYFYSFSRAFHVNSGRPKSYVVPFASRRVFYGRYTRVTVLTLYAVYTRADNVPVTFRRKKRKTFDASRGVRSVASKRQHGLAFRTYP